MSFAISFLVGAAISAVVGVVTSVLTSKSASDDREQAKEIADNNFALEQEQFEYEKDLQSTIMEREDNAIQRQVSDSRAAGISPLLNMTGAQSSGASGVAVNTPQKDSSWLGLSNPMSLLAQGLSVSMLSAVGDLVAKGQQLDMQQAMNTAAVNSINSNTKFANDTFDYRVDNLKFGSQLSEAQYNDFIREADYRDRNHIYTSTPSNPYGIAGALVDLFQSKFGSKGDQEPYTPQYNVPIPPAVAQPVVKDNVGVKNYSDMVDRFVEGLYKQQVASYNAAVAKGEKRRNKRREAWADTLYQNSQRLRQDAYRVGTY